MIAFMSRQYAQFDTLAGTGREAGGISRMRQNMLQFLTRYVRPDYPVDALYVFGLRTDNRNINDGDVPAITQWNATYEYPKIIVATDSDYFRYVLDSFGHRLPVYRGTGGAFWADAAGSSVAETIRNRDSQRTLPIAEMVAS